MGNISFLYLAGGLFNAGERLHNLFLERALTKLGYEVVLPQREALRYLGDTGFDLCGIVANCQKASADPCGIYVGNLDGGDADSGTCVEYGIAITATGRAIVYRTDFRTALDKELGVNAMLRAEGTEFIYEPCFFTELDQVESYYDGLAQKIHQALLVILMPFPEIGQTSCTACGCPIEPRSSQTLCGACQASEVCF